MMGWATAWYCPARWLPPHGLHDGGSGRGRATGEGSVSAGTGHGTVRHEGIMCYEDADGGKGAGAGMANQGFQRYIGKPR